MVKNRRSTRKKGRKKKLRWGDSKKVECRIPKKHKSIRWLWTSKEECKKRTFRKKGCRDLCLKSIKRGNCFNDYKYCCNGGPGC